MVSDTERKTDRVVPATPARRSLAVLTFPAAVILIGFLLGIAGVSGSSVARFGESRGAEPAFGRVRDIRFDEFYVRTPLVVRQSALGYPTESITGVGEHDMGVVASLPVGGWQNLLRPHQVSYRVFGVERAFALEWWMLQLILPAIGVYALMLVCRARPLLASLTALLFVFCPAMQWWTSTAFGAMVGYGCLAGAAVIVAVRTPRLWWRVALAVAAGWLGACFVAMLYLPWLIPIVLVVGAAALAMVVRDLVPERRWRAHVGRVLPVLAGAAIVGGVLVLAFAVAHRDALSAITNSVYPGQRRRSGGSGELRRLLGAPFDVIQALHPQRVVSVNGKNQSESSGGVFLLAAVLATLLGDPRRSLVGKWRDRIVPLAVIATGFLLVAWYLLPIPSIVGRVVALDRVPPYRLLPPIAFASTLAMGLFLAWRDRWVPRQRTRAAIAGTVVFAVCIGWAATQFTIDGFFVSPWQLAVVAVAFVATVGLTLWRGQWGMIALVVLVGVGAAVVHPIQIGLDPLTDSPGAALGRTLRERPNAGAVVFFANDPGGDILPLSAMSSSGVELVSGVNLYPNEDAWRTLDPDETERHIWDRYANALWGVADDGAAAHVYPNTKDSVIVIVDPCDAALDDLGVGTVVSFVPLDRWCLVETARTPRPGATPLRAYRIDRNRPQASAV